MSHSKKTTKPAEETPAKPVTEQEKADAATAAGVALPTADGQAPVATPDEPDEPDVEPEDTEPAEFAGQYLVSTNLTATTSERLGRKVIEIKPLGWVGPGFELSASRLQELATLLSGIKNLPEQE